MRNAGRKLFFFFTLVIFAGALFCFRNVPLVKATNWLTGWSYRQQYTISQTTGAGTNYQINVTVSNSTGISSGYLMYADGHVKNSDFSDVRVTASDGSTLLSIYNETVNSGADATIWFKDTDNLSSGDSTVYVYYGNSGSSIVWNGDGVFSFFDDFRSESSLNTTKWNATGSYSLGSGYLQLNSGSYVNQNATTYAFFSSPKAVTFTCNFSSNTFNTYYDEEGFGVNVGDAQTHAMVNSGDKWSVRNSSGSNTIGSVNWHPNTSFQHYEVLWANSSWVDFRQGSTDFGNPATSNPDQAMGAFARAETAGYYMRTEYIFVRNYVQPEPSQGSWAAEEAVDITPPNYSIIGSNETKAGYAVKCYVLWADGAGASGFIFSMNNTGSWINQTWAAVSSNWGNYSFTLNATIGVPVGWKEWCNDTSNNWNNTGIQTITTTDGTLPTFTLPSPSYNETRTGQLCLFSSQWTDNVAISIVLFRTNNTGAWINYTTTGSSGWYNYTLTLNGTPGNNVSYDWWANDTNNNWNTTMTAQTFTTTLNAFLNLRTVDVDGNTLTGTTIYMSNGTTIGAPIGLPPGTGYAIVGSSGWFTTITSNGWANYTGITNSTIYLYVKWYGLQVYSLTQLNLTGDTTTNLVCLAYPFTVNSIQFWAASDASVTAHSYASNILTLSFSSPLNNYTLISSCPIIPRYILNITYNIGTCFSTYLSLLHYGNATLTLSYEDWGDLYVQSTDQTLSSASITSGILAIVPKGSYGIISTLQVHCGSYGNPTSTTGFTTGTYGLTVYSGTYILNGQTLTLSWASLPSNGGETGTTGPTFNVNIAFDFPSTVAKGQVVNGTLTVQWQSYAMIFIWQVACQSPYSSWVVNLGALPLSLQTAQSQGNMSVPVTLTIPADVADGNFQIPCSVTFQTPTGLAKTVGSTVALTVGAVQPSGTGLSVPFIVMAGFLGLFGVFVLTLFARRSSKARKQQF